MWDTCSDITQRGSIGIPKRLCFSQTWANLGFGFVVQVILVFVEFVDLDLIKRSKL